MLTPRYPEFTLALAEGKTKGSMRLDAGYGLQLILCSGAPERSLASAPAMTNPCFS
jgi:hypothetical protein